MNSDVNARAGARSRLGSTVSDESALAVPTTRKSRLSSTASSTSGGPNKETKNPYKYSLAIVGSCGVGKTCLTAQFASADAVFYKDYNPTVEGWLTRSPATTMRNAPPLRLF